MNEPLRKKSPRAPTIPLDEALDRAIKVYAKERLHAAPTDVVAQHIGYKNANNGAALTTLASMRYYGVLDRPREGQMAVAKSVEEYQFAPDDSHRRKVLAEWLKSPPIFADLLERYASGLPSDATLRFDLIQRGFNPSSAEIVITAFRKSAEFVGYFEQSARATPIASDDTELNDAVSSNEPINAAVTKSNNDLAKDVTSSLVDETNSLGMDKIPVRLTGGRRAWLVIPSPFFEADKQRLKAQIDLLLSDDENSTLV